MGKLAQRYVPIIVGNQFPQGPRVASELSLRACTLRERYPGAHAQVPHQKDAHTKRRLRPSRMDDGALADANKA
jgi:hypothetical protein